MIIRCNEDTHHFFRFFFCILNGFDVLVVETQEVSCMTETNEIFSFCIEKKMRTVIPSMP